MSALSNRRLRVLWILIFWVAVGVGSYVLGVLSQTGQLVEENALSASQYNTNPPAPLSLVSPLTIAVALIAIGLVALWVHGIYRTLVVTLVPAVAIVASQLLKSQVLGRPNFMDFNAVNTFPSGHMTVFTAIVGAAVLASPRWIRASVALAGAVLLGVVGWQLLTYGWHRPSDVLGALALGVASFAAVTLLSPLRPARGVILVRTVSIGLAFTGWIAVVGSLILTIVAYSLNSSGLMLNAGQGACIAVGMLAAHALLRLSMLAHSAKE